MESDDPVYILSKSYRIISIHALRMESDQQQKRWQLQKLLISIHALRMESDSST